MTTETAAEILPFPRTASARFVQFRAERMMRHKPDRVLSDTLDERRGELRRRGVREEVIERDVRELGEAITAAYALMREERRHGPKAS